MYLKVVAPLVRDKPAAIRCGAFTKNTPCGSPAWQPPPTTADPQRHHQAKGKKKVSIRAVLLPGRRDPWACVSRRCSCFTTSRDVGSCASSYSDHKRNVVRAPVATLFVPRLGLAISVVGWGGLMVVT
ncbi:hypothetical protein AOQ84DRAFT_357361, partial [Glonium stellatum]